MNPERIANHLLDYIDMLKGQKQSNVQQIVQVIKEPIVTDEFKQFSRQVLEVSCVMLEQFNQFQNTTMDLIAKLDGKLNVMQELIVQTIK